MTSIHLKQGNQDQRPAILTQRISEMSADRRFRLRAILIEKNDAQWGAKIIILQGFRLETTTPDAVSSINLDGVILHESWLSPQDVIAFLDEIDAGTLLIANKTIPLETQPRWSIEQTCTASHFLQSAGLLAQLSLPREEHLSGRDFLDPSRGIYFPDTEALINHWMPFSPAYGHSDGRMGSVHLIIPEERAYFVNVIQDEKFIAAELSGRALDNDIMLGAAIMSHEGLTHVNQTIDGTDAQFSLPASTISWTLILYNTAGEIFDSWTNRYFSALNGISANGDFEASVRAALKQGEGLQIEFKPFLHLPSSQRGQKQEKSQKPKFGEILRTIVAMANADGGQIFLGISDHLELDPKAEVLCEWADTKWNAVILEKYGKALLATLNDQLVLSVPLSVGCEIIDDAPVIMIAVQPNKKGQLSNIRGGWEYWVRRGASNQRLPPSEWQSLTPQSDFLGGLTLA